MPIIDQLLASPPAPSFLPRARLVVVTPPAAEPVSTADAKLWLRVDHTADDTLIADLVKSARAIFEDLTGRTLIDTVYRAEWDALPRAGTHSGASTGRQLLLPRGPLKSSSPVDWVKYADTAGAEQTFAASNYTVDGGRDPGLFGRIWLNESASWPDLGSYPGALRCQFTAGYGTAASAVPAEIATCVKLIVTHLYQNRAPVNVGAAAHELPWSLTHLIDQHRIAHLA